MKIKKGIWLAGCFCSMFAAQAAILPLSFQAGRIDSLDRSSAALKFIQQEAALKQGKLTPEDNDSSLLEERVPEEGLVYIQLAISVFPERTLSPLDYILVVEGREYPSLGMALSQTKIFDFRNLEAKGPCEVLLLYECPASALGATLKSVFDDLPIPPVSGLVLQEPEPPAPAEKTEAPQEKTLEENKEAAPEPDKTASQTEKK
ncbi:MAG: hypothetical protein WCT05_02340 [Lentisphaeria bacterium]